MQAADAHLAGAWKLVAASCGGDADDDGEVALIATGSPLAFFNLAVVHRPPERPEAALDRIQRFFDERELEYRVWASDAHDPGLHDAAVARGMEAVGQSPGMVRDSRPAPPLPAGLEVQVVRGLDMYDRYIALIAEVFGLPVDLVTDVFRPALFSRTGVVGLLGTVDGEDVATSAMVPAVGMAGVYMVGTPEDHRRKGYGEALTWAAVAAGHEQGLAQTTLQASAMGRPVYERMGYTTYANYIQLGLT